MFSNANMNSVVDRARNMSPGFNVSLNFNRASYDSLNSALYGLRGTYPNTFGSELVLASPSYVSLRGKKINIDSNPTFFPKYDFDGKVEAGFYRNPTMGSIVVVVEGDPKNPFYLYFKGRYHGQSHGGGRVETAGKLFKFGESLEENAQRSIGELQSGGINLNHTEFLYPNNRFFNALNMTPYEISGLPNLVLGVAASIESDGINELGDVRDLRTHEIPFGVKPENLGEFIRGVEESGMGFLAETEQCIRDYAELYGIIID